MRAKLVVFFAVMGLLVMGPGSASATFIDFDAMGLGNIDGQHIGPAFPEGVTITSSDGSASVILGNQAGFGFETPNNTVSNNGYITAATLTFTFDVGRGFVAFAAGDSGGDTDQFTYTAYDVNNIVLYSATTPVYGGNPIDVNNFMVDVYHVNLTGIGYIKKLVVSNAINAGILIDDLQYCQPVPIPGAVWLLGSGLLGLLGLRRRFLG